MCFHGAALPVLDQLYSHNLAMALLTFKQNFTDFLHGELIRQIMLRAFRPRRAFMRRLQAALKLHRYQLAVVVSCQSGHGYLPVLGELYSVFR